MGGSKQPSSTTTTTKTELPAWIQPYSEGYLNKSMEAANRPYEQYQGQRVTPFTQEQELGLTGTANRAMLGNSAVNAGQGMLTNTLGGMYLNPNSNPYLRQNVDTAMGQVQGNLNSQFNRPGAFGNTAHQEVMARSLGDVAANMYGQNYTAERNNQMNAANQALAYGQNDYTDLNAMLSAGDTRRQYNTDINNLNYQNWLDQQNYPLKQLDIQGNAIGTAMGNTGQSSTTGPNPYQGSNTANLLGYGSLALGAGGLLS